MTAPTGDTQVEIQPGRQDVVESQSSSRPFMTVFEDDGETGYFYALDLTRERGNQIVDAVQIYLVPEEPGEVNNRVLRILWSPDGDKSALEFDGAMRAVFDFPGRLACSLSEAPPSSDGWRRIHARSPGQIAEFFVGKAV